MVKKKTEKYSPSHYPRSILRIVGCPYCKLVMGDKEQPYQCLLLEVAKGDTGCKQWDFEHCPLIQRRVC